MIFCYEKVEKSVEWYYKNDVYKFGFFVENSVYGIF